MVTRHCDLHHTSLQLHSRQTCISPYARDSEKSLTVVPRIMVAFVRKFRAEATPRLKAS
jgi:hypothetical protein